MPKDPLESGIAAETIEARIYCEPGKPGISLFAGDFQMGDRFLAAA